MSAGLHGDVNLPNELVYHIVRLAASTDHRFAHKCAYVSRQVCQWTRADRWKTVIITTAWQCDKMAQATLLAEDISLKLVRNPSLFTTFPSRTPAEFIENLFIAAPFEAVIKTPDWLFKCLHVNYLALDSDDLELAYHMLWRSSPTKFLCVWLDKSVNMDYPFIEHEPPVWKQCHCRNSQSVLHQINSSSSALPAQPPSAACPQTVPCFSNFRRRLTNLHVIGIDENSEMTGVSCPPILESLRSGSTSTSSLLSTLACDRHQGADVKYGGLEDDIGRAIHRIRSRWELHPYDNAYGNIRRSHREECSQGVTSVRYDTRQFAFRPCEITAMHLKPFFQELIVQPTALDNAAPTSNFTHAGPRHAAPHRGAGNWHRLNAVKVDKVSPLQSHLDHLGSRQFQRLELCWDPLTPVDIAPNSAAAQARQWESDSGWPMERQDIWTNTSSHNNTARAPPPYQPQRAQQQQQQQQRATSAFTSTRRDQKGKWKWKVDFKAVSAKSRGFRADLVDAVRTTIGWTTLDQEQLGLTASPHRALAGHRFGSARAQLSRQDMDNALNGLLADSIERTKACNDAAAANLAFIGDNSPPVRPTLQPAFNKLKLGEHYVPFTMQERLAWFLDNLDTDEA